jgi:hypothetical protein
LVLWLSGFSFPLGVCVKLPQEVSPLGVRNVHGSKRLLIFLHSLSPHIEEANTVLPSLQALQSKLEPWFTDKIDVRAAPFDMGYGLALFVNFCPSLIESFSQVPAVSISIPRRDSGISTSSGSRKFLGLAGTSKKNMPVTFFRHRLLAL